VTRAPAREPPPPGRPPESGESRLMMPTLLLLLLLLLAAVAAAEESPPLPSCTPMGTGACWHNQAKASHVASFQIWAANSTAAACACFANCSAMPACKHWHLKGGAGTDKPGSFGCDLRSADVHLGSGQCLHDTNPAPAPAPGPPAPGPYPQPPIPPPSPPSRPALGFKPHLIFNLGDDVGHFNFGWRGNKEARTPHIDSLVRQQGLILERHCE
jgi:hypothetical protein